MIDNYEEIKAELKDNLDRVEENINNTLLKMGRKREDVTLLAVTKTVDSEKINAMLELGVKNIGENKAQELTEKFPEISGDAIWHFIGHLQTNKVKYIIDKVKLIHSLDRLSLAKEINKKAEAENIVKEVLLEVNIAEEESKFGLKKEETIPFIEQILDFKNIKIKGLMTIAPFAENPEEVRYVFRDLKKLGEEIERKSYPNLEMKYYSMGMTNDYTIALEEGSNIVRIGTGLFGKRIYK